MRSLTFLFYEYARVRTWMERAPRRERWMWYGWLIVWLTITLEVI